MELYYKTRNMTVCRHRRCPYSKRECTTVSLLNRRWCMEQCYRHFDHKERTLIYWWRKEKLSLREIARHLRRSHTSVSRKLQRNRWYGKPYFQRGAQILASSLLRRRAKRNRLKSKQVQAYVHEPMLGYDLSCVAAHAQGRTDPEERKMSPRDRLKALVNVREWIAGRS